jgi:hypothetical protein
VHCAIQASREKKGSPFKILKLPCLIVTQTQLDSMSISQMLRVGHFILSKILVLLVINLTFLAVLWRYSQYSCSPFYHINMHTCCDFLKCVQAKQLVGSTFLVREEDRPELDEGEFYTRDLIGMRVVLKVCAYYYFIQINSMCSF